MSIREQTHNKHKWENRVRDWLIMPHGSLPTAKSYKQHIITKKELSLHRSPTTPTSMVDPSLPPNNSDTPSAQSATLWMAIDGIVYDVTRFVSFHPGGVKLMHQYSGIDATDGYHKHHTPIVDLDALLGGFKVGVLEGSHLAEAALVAHLPPPPSYESALSKSSHGASSLNSNDIAAIAKKSQLFEGVSEQVLLEAVANEVHRGNGASSSSLCQQKEGKKEKGKVGVQLLPTDPSVECSSSKATTTTAPLSSPSQKEAEDEALLAIFDVLDKDGTGMVPLLAVAEFLVNIEACSNVTEAEAMVTKLAEVEAVQQGYFNKPQYLKLAEQL